MTKSEVVEASRSLALSSWQIRLIVPVVEGLCADRAAAERAAIVAWLREVANGATGSHFRSTLIFAADAIERGDHAKVREADNG